MLLSIFIAYILLKFYVDFIHFLAEFLFFIYQKESVSFHELYEK